MPKMKNGVVLYPYPRYRSHLFHFKMVLQKEKKNKKKNSKQKSIFIHAMIITSTGPKHSVDWTDKDTKGEHLASKANTVNGQPKKSPMFGFDLDWFGVWNNLIYGWMQVNISKWQREKNGTVDNAQLYGPYVFMFCIEPWFLVPLNDTTTTWTTFRNKSIGIGWNIHGKIRITNIVIILD